MPAAPLAERRRVIERVGRTVTVWWAVFVTVDIALGVAILGLQYSDTWDIPFTPWPALLFVIAAAGVATVLWRYATNAISAVQPMHEPGPRRAVLRATLVSGIFALVLGLVANVALPIVMIFVLMSRPFSPVWLLLIGGFTWSLRKLVGRYWVRTLAGPDDPGSSAVSSGG